MKKLFYLAGAALFISASSSAATLEDRITSGAKHVEKKDYKRAVKDFEEAVRQNPGHAKANLLLGLAYANTGDFEKAVKFSQASVAIEPSYSGYHNLGLVYANRGELDKAVDAYQRALQMNPAAFRTWYQLGLIQAAGGNFKEAVEAHKKSIFLNSSFADAYLGLASASYWSGDTKTAREQVRQLELTKNKAKAKELSKWLDEKEKAKTEGPKPSATPALPEAKK